MKSRSRAIVNKPYAVWDSSHDLRVMSLNEYAEVDVHEANQAQPLIYGRKKSRDTHITQRNLLITYQLRRKIVLASCLSGGSLAPKLDRSELV